MKKMLLFALVLMGFNAFAQPLWMRDNVISPKGDKIAFEYKGDIYVVDAKGGKALQITTNASYECNPDTVPKSVSERRG